MKSSAIKILCILRTLALLAATGAGFVTEGYAQTFDLLYVFNPYQTDGEYPETGLILGNDGNLYGTTWATSWGGGSVFKIMPSGALTYLQFLDSTNGYPEGPLVQASNGNFYGATKGGPYGDPTAFKISPSGDFTYLTKFTNYSEHYVEPNGITEGPDGNFYGTTKYGSIYGDYLGSYGTIFKMTPDGTLTTLVNFDGSKGEIPFDPLLLASDGNFYGTSTTSGSGTIFRVTTNGTFTNLVGFLGTNGAGPGFLIQTKDDYIYGSTGAGGKYNKGTLFRMTTNGQFTTLINWDGTNYGGIVGNVQLIEASDGFFYGEGSRGLNDDGLLFRMTKSGQITVITSFDWDTTGAYPNRLTEGRDGNLYGTLKNGGYYGAGTIYRIIMPRPQLVLRHTTSQITFSWPTNFPGFKLQSTDNLNFTNWIDCADSPAMVGEQYVVTNSASAGIRFYRLKR